MSYQILIISNLATTWSNFLNSISWTMSCWLNNALKIAPNLSLGPICTIFSAFSKTCFFILFTSDTIFEYSGLYVVRLRVKLY